MAAFDHRWAFRPFVALALAPWFSMAGCAGSDGDGGSAGGTGPGATSSASTGATGGSTGELPPESGPFSDGCNDPPTLGPGVFEGALGGASNTVGDPACGFGGPDRFARIEVPVRADLWAYAVGEGFVPSVRWFRAGCALDAGADACGRGRVVWALDVQPTSALLLSIGGPSGLEGEGRFRVEVGMRPIVGVGAACAGAPEVRCEPGTVCDLSADVPVCVALPGDVCADPIVVDLEAAAEVAQTVDWGRGYGDAHASTCGGARRKDAVFRVDGPAGAGLEVSAPGAVVAVRTATCVPDAEAACAAEAVEVPAPAAFADGPSYVFVEGPQVGAFGPPTDVTFRRLPP